MDKKQKRNGSRDRSRLYRTDRSTIGYRTLDGPGQYEQDPEEEADLNIFDTGDLPVARRTSEKGGRVIEPRDPYDVSQLMGQVDYSSLSYEEDAGYDAYDYEEDHPEEERLRARRAARQERRRERERKRARQRRIRMIILLLILAAVCGIVWFVLRSGIFKGKTEPAESAVSAVTGEAETAIAQDSEVPESDEGAAAEEIAVSSAYDIQETANTVTIPDLSEDTSDPAFVDSKYAVLFDVDSGEIVAERDSDEVISPASMTKILTILAAADNITEDQLEDRFTMTQEIADYTYTTGCTVAGFEKGDSIRVEELFYGTILPSGADGAAGLAYYVGGSIEGFADLMNAEVQKLGRSATAHFDNPVGVYSENNYCTVKDMGIIMKAAMENEFCAKVLSARTYQCTAANSDNPDGILLSNWFLRRIEDKDTGGTVVAAKTGYVEQAGFCAASYFESESGHHYICVTADTYSTWRSIYDHVAIYKTYAK